MTTCCLYATGQPGLKYTMQQIRWPLIRIKLHSIAIFNAFDVIPLGEVLIMIGTDGLYQYDYSDPENIRELSVIPISSLQHVF